MIEEFHKFITKQSVSSYIKKKEDSLLINTALVNNSILWGQNLLSQKIRKLDDQCRDQLINVVNNGKKEQNLTMRYDKEKQCLLMPLRILSNSCLITVYKSEHGGITFIYNNVLCALQTNAITLPHCTIKTEKVNQVLNTSFKIKTTRPKTEI